MPRPQNKFPGVTKAKSRHGKLMWRLRRKMKWGKVDTYIAGVYGSSSFKAAYEAAIAPPDKTSIKSAFGTMDYVIERYYRNRMWTKDIRETTRLAKRPRLEAIREMYGHKSLATITAHDVQKLMASKDGDAAANRALKDLRQLYNFARRVPDAYGVKFKGANPTEGIKPHKIKSLGHRAWTAEEVAQFRTAFPTGSMQRFAFELALGTGAARQDLAVMGAGNLRAGRIFYARIKTGQEVSLKLNLLPDLENELRARNLLGLRFITHSDDQPYSVAGLGNWFREAVKIAELPKQLSIHGLRKYGAIRLAYTGASEAQIMAFLGHTTPDEARTYWGQANRDRLNDDALRAVLNDQELSNRESGLGNNIIQVYENKG